MRVSLFVTTHPRQYELRVGVVGGGGGVVGGGGGGGGGGCTGGGRLKLIPPWTKRHFQVRFHKWKVLYLDSNLLKFAPRVPFDNKKTLVQVIAWRRIGDKPLPEPSLT